ncbi:hypothetical protein [Maribacter aestuarii]|uniref:hypothetical protein n=1 Tax=Maribacter aestuarii TaxID=1130723 RepID=UPI00248B412D|nr:hypothetical protein [Maribacter aestuarii]
MKTIKEFLILSVITFFTSNMSAQEITVFQGAWGNQFYQDKEKMTWKEFAMAMDNNPASQVYWSKAKKQYGVTFITARPT